MWYVVASSVSNVFGVKNTMWSFGMVQRSAVGALTLGAAASGAVTPREFRTIRLRAYPKNILSASVCTFDMLTLISLIEGKWGP